MDPSKLALVWQWMGECALIQVVLLQYMTYVPSLVAEAQLHSLTIQNIQNGFRVSGIHPFNRNVFTDENFAPAEVINYPYMGIANCTSSNSTGQKFTNFKQPNTSSTGLYDIPLRRLGETLYKETYVSLRQR